MSETLGVGSTVYLFDQNCRVYQKNEDGRAIGPPIWIEHWRPYKIVGENRMMWLLEGGEKFPKKNGTRTAARGGYTGMTVATSWEAVKEQEWLHVHRYSIARAVERCQDISTLRQISAILLSTGVEVGERLAHV
jgi:hypothetical protein